MSDVKAFLAEVVEQVSTIMESLICELCYGCQVDHPSQRQHDLCLMASDKERLTATFWTAWSRMNIEQIHESLGDLVFERLSYKGELLYIF